MPLEYRHSNVESTPTLPFRCDLVCQQCSAPRSDGERCKRKICAWLPFCYQHSESFIGISVKDSTAIPGSKGLFATRPFETGEMVAPYGGEVLSEAEVKSRYGDGEYSLGPYLLYDVDSACKRFVASASNGAFGGVPSSMRNVILDRVAHRHGTVKQKGDVYQGRVLSASNMGIKYWSIASRPISKGEEIIADYGEEGYVDAFVRRQARCEERGVVCDSTKRRSSKRKK